MCVLDLQTAFASARAPPEYFQDEAGAIEHLAGPGLFQIPLLHRRKRSIDDDDSGVFALHKTGDFLDLSLADQRCRPHRCQWHDAGGDDLEVDCLGQRHGFLKPSLRRTEASALGQFCQAAHGPSQVGFENDHATTR